MSVNQLVDRMLTYVRRSGVPLIWALAGSALAQSAPPGFTTKKTGAQTDFDYFEGAWTTVQRVLKKRGVDDWEVSTANLCMTRYLGGMATVDELYFPTTGKAGLTLRVFNPNSSQWSIYWVSSATGQLDPVPVVGGFENGRGEFYAEDNIGGTPVKVRYLWLIKSRELARWEQAISYDNATWETNWTADFTRGDAKVLCRHGQPIRDAAPVSAK